MSLSVWYGTTTISGIWNGADGASCVRMLRLSAAVPMNVRRETSHRVLNIACTHVGNGRMGCRGWVERSLQLLSWYSDMSWGKGLFDAQSCMAASLEAASSSKASRALSAGPDFSLADGSVCIHLATGKVLAVG